jgi:hypothetical protein
MSNLRTPRDPHAAGAAIQFFEINEDRVELLRAEDEIRGLLTGFFGLPEEKLPTAEQSGALGEQMRADKIIAALRGKPKPGGAA